MKRNAIALAFSICLPAAAHAEVGLVSVPVLCGTSADVMNTLAVKMPTPEEIGGGGDGRGVPIATLLTGNGYWALLAMLSSDRVCVVASGHDWTVTDPAKAF
ncbi:hypothetical protein BH10PSE9_BH10PSE9_20440 [soil metagenome]